MSFKTFCIVLPEEPEKIEKARAYFEQEGLDVEFFHGIHAQKAGLQTEHLYERDNPGTGWRIGHIPTGIWLAHYTLWNTLKHLPYERILIMENDVKFEDNWRTKLETALHYMPDDWDMLYTGSCCAKGFPRTHVVGDLYESKHMQCTHSYMLQRKALTCLLSMRKIWAPVDIQMQLECFPHLKTFVIMPQIHSQWNTEIPP